MKFLLPCSLILFCCVQERAAWAQMDLYPAHFGQVEAFKNVLNPALPNAVRATNFTFCNQFYTGAFSKIDNLFFVGTVNLNPGEEARVANSIGVKFVNEQEGEFISRSKYYASYSIRSKLFEDYWLGLGVNLGRAGYVFKGTNVSALGSDSDWDGDLGIALEGPTFCLAGSVNQMFNSMILPKDLYFRWRRFFSIYAEKKVEIGEKVLLSAYVQNQFLPSQNHVTDLGLQCTFVHHFLLGINVHLRRSVSFVVGIKNITLEKHHFSLYTSYNMLAGSQSTANVQSFEMSLAYFLK